MALGDNVGDVTVNANAPPLRKGAFIKPLEIQTMRLHQIRQCLMDGAAFTAANPTSPLAMSAAEQAFYVAEGQRILALAQTTIAAYNAAST